MALRQVKRAVGIRRSKLGVSFCCALALVISAEWTAAHARDAAAAGPGIQVVNPNNPLEYLPDSQLTAMGFTVYHPVELINYPDGGYANVFDTRAGRATLPVPPNGFDPNGATDTELQQYQFPARPHDPAGLATWKAQVERLHSTAPTWKIIEAPSTADYWSYNWSGYEANGSSAHYYEQSVADWQEPSISGACGQLASLATWAGLSGGGNFPFNQTDIEQAGTDSYYDPTSGSHAYHVIWWEAWPYQFMQLTGGVVNAYDTAQAAVTDLQYLGHQAFDWSVSDENTGFYENGQQSLPSAYSKQEVEWVAERASTNNVYNNLLPHTSFSFTYTSASWANGNGNAYSLGSVGFHMVSSDQQRTLETNSALSSSGTWSTSWMQCS